MTKKSILLLVLILLSPLIVKAELNRRGEIHLGMETNPYQINSDSLANKSLITQFVLDVNNDEEEQTYYYYIGNFYLNTKYSDLNYSENTGGISHNFVNSEKWQFFGGGNLKISYAKDYADGYSNYQETRAYVNATYAPNQNISFLLGNTIGYRLYFEDYFSDYFENILSAKTAADILPNTLISLHGEYFYKRFSTESYQINQMNQYPGPGQCGHHTNPPHTDYMDSYKPNNSQLLLSAHLYQKLKRNMAFDIEYKKSINFSQSDSAYIASSQVQNPFIKGVFDDHYAYISNDISTTLEIQFSRTNLELQIFADSYHRKYPKRLALDINGEPKEDYSEQEDKIQIVGISATKTYKIFWQPFFDIFADYSYTKSESNDELYTYNAHFVSIGLGIYF